MQKEEAEQKVKEILGRNTLCIVATASLRGKPEAALIEYAEDKEMNIYFATEITAKTYKNIRENRWSAVIITEIPNIIQIEGTIEEMPKDAAEAVKQRLVKKHGEKSCYMNTDIRFFRLKTQGIRLGQGTGAPSEVIVVKE